MEAAKGNRRRRDVSIFFFIGAVLATQGRPMRKRVGCVSVPTSWTQDWQLIALVARLPITARTFACKELFFWRSSGEKYTQKE